MHTEKKEERVIIETYSDELMRITSNPAMVFVHKFGQRQNAYNRNMETRMQAVQSVCRRFQGEINSLREENDTLRAELELERNRSRELFERQAQDMIVIRKVVQDLRLRTKLDSNACERHELIIKELEEKITQLEKALAEKESTSPETENE